MWLSWRKTTGLAIVVFPINFFTENTGPRSITRSFLLHFCNGPLWELIELCMRVFKVKAICTMLDNFTECCYLCVRILLGQILKKNCPYSCKQTHPSILLVKELAVFTHLKRLITKTIHVKSLWELFNFTGYIEVYRGKILNLSMPFKIYILCNLSFKMFPVTVTRSPYQFQNSVMYSFLTHTFTYNTDENFKFSVKKFSATLSNFIWS